MKTKAVDLQVGDEITMADGCCVTIKGFHGNLMFHTGGACPSDTEVELFRRPERKPKVEKAPVPERSKEQMPVVKGRKYLAVMPYSEVCMHMKVADKMMLIELIDRNAVQLYWPNGQWFSAPILASEAGVLHQGTTEEWKESKGFYFYPPVGVEQPVADTN